MAVPDLFLRQKLQTMNAHALLADLLDLVTPINFHQHLFNSLTASLQSLLTNSQCTVTAIGRGIDSDAAERHCIKRADRLLRHVTMQQVVTEFYTAMTSVKQCLFRHGETFLA